jgi:hypothetical protein
MDWIDLVQNRDGWQALVNAVMNLWVPQNAADFLTGEKRLASQEELLNGVSYVIEFDLVKAFARYAALSNGQTDGIFGPDSVRRPPDVGQII